MESIKEAVQRNTVRLLSQPGINISELARLSKLTSSTIHKWKAGIHVPEAANIERLAEAMNIDPLEFYEKERVGSRMLPSVHSAFKRALNVPEKIFEYAEFLGVENQIWENEIIPLLEAAVEDDELARQKSSQRA